MKRVYLLIFVGIVAVVVIVVSLISFDPKSDTWISLFVGAGVGFLVVGAPSIIAYLKRKQNGSK
jgi:pilus assembly protein TadC